MRPPVPEVITSGQLQKVAEELGVDGNHVRALHFDAARWPRVVRLEMYEVNEEGAHVRTGHGPQDGMAVFVVDVPVCRPEGHDWASRRALGYVGDLDRIQCTYCGARQTVEAEAAAT